jgi:hypothetical protein
MLRSLIVKDYHSVLYARTYATRMRGPRKQKLNQTALSDYAHLVGTDTSVKLRCHFTRGCTIYKETFGYFVKDTITQGRVLYEKTIGCFLDDVVMHLKDIWNDTHDPKHKGMHLPPATTVSHVFYNVMMRFCIGILFISGFILSFAMALGFMIACWWVFYTFPNTTTAMVVMAIFTGIGWCLV